MLRGTHSFLGGHHRVVKKKKKNLKRDNNQSISFSNRIFFLFRLNSAFDSKMVQLLNPGLMNFTFKAQNRKCRSIPSILSK